MIPSNYIRFEMPVDVTVEEPRTRIVCGKSVSSFVSIIFINVENLIPECNIISCLPNIDSVSLDRVYVVVSRRVRDSDDVKVVTLFTR